MAFGKYDSADWKTDCMMQCLFADRKFNPGLPADRADVIVGGCCVLVGVMRKLRIPEIMVSVNNLLDGLVRDELKLS